jgi:tetratricopeptide (TPR) repeat protein
MKKTLTMKRIKLILLVLLINNSVVIAQEDTLKQYYRAYIQREGSVSKDSTEAKTILAFQYLVKADPTDEDLWTFFGDYLEQRCHDIFGTSQQFHKDSICRGMSYARRQVESVRATKKMRANQKSLDSIRAMNNHPRDSLRYALLDRWINPFSKNVNDLTIEDVPAIGDSYSKALQVMPGNRAIQSDYFKFVTHFTHLNADLLPDCPGCAPGSLMDSVAAKYDKAFPDADTWEDIIKTVHSLTDPDKRVLQDSPKANWLGLKFGMKLAKDSSASPASQSSCIEFAHNLMVLGKTLKPDELKAVLGFAQDVQANNANDYVSRYDACSFLAWYYDQIADYKEMIKWDGVREKMGHDKMLREKRGTETVYTGGTRYDSEHDYHIDDYWAKANIITDPSGDSWYGMARSLQSKNPRSALGAVKKAISMGCVRFKWDAPMLAGWILYSDMKDINGAAAYYNKASLLGTATNRQNSFEVMGDMYKDVKQYQNALSNYQKGVAQNPSTAKPIYSKMADCYSALGNVSKATYYKKLASYY